MSFPQFLALLFILYLLFGDTVSHTTALKRYIKKSYYEYRERKAEEKIKEKEEENKRNSSSSSTKSNTPKH